MLVHIIQRFHCTYILYMLDMVRLVVRLLPCDITVVGMGFHGAVIVWVCVITDSIVVWEFPDKMTPLTVQNTFFRELERLQKRNVDMCFGWSSWHTGCMYLDWASPVHCVYSATIHCIMEKKICSSFWGHTRHNDQDTREI